MNLFRGASQNGASKVVLRVQVPRSLLDRVGYRNSTRSYEEASVKHI